MLIQLRRSPGNYVGVKDVYPVTRLNVTTTNPSSKRARISIKAEGYSTEMAEVRHRRAYMSMTLNEAQLLANRLAAQIEAARKAHAKADLI